MAYWTNPEEFSDQARHPAARPARSGPGLLLRGTPLSPPSINRIVILGDSLTSGHGIGRALSFPSVLQARMEAEGLAYQIVNKGVSGNTTADGLARVDECLAAPPRLLVVALGVNDGLRGVPVAQVKNNLREILRRATASGTPVLLCRMEALPLYGWPYVEAFRRMYDELAAETGVRLAPFLLFGVLGNAAMMQGDRVHPNAHGARAMADMLWPHLRAALAA